MPAREAVRIGAVIPALIGIGALSACQPARSAQSPLASSSAATNPSPTDTVRGVLVMEGSDPMPVAALRTPAGRVVLDGAPLNMTLLSQLELCVRGTSTPPGRFNVRDFLVRRANDRPAFDGTVKLEGTNFILVLSEGGDHPLRGAPAPFNKFVGKRVWVTESPEGRVADYGVI